jgi:topoisomerase-4 subunit B
LASLREAVVKTLRDFYKKDYDAADIRSGLIAAISVRVQDPVFESQTKTKLGSHNMGPEGPTLRSYINDFVKTHLDNYLHKNPEAADAVQRRIQQAERERKEMAGIRKLATERAKKAAVFNKKLRDCKVHRNSNHERAAESTLFMCEGDSASGSITKSRDPQTQAVFSLRGKPLNAFGLTKKVVYENEEFNLLQHALDIEDGIENLRYNQIVLATDADVDGMHIRLLLLTFFLQFFPELVRGGHVYVLQTPLFRVRTKDKTIYCYDESEKQAAVRKLGAKSEITRFKGLGEISPGEFARFIGADMRLDPVLLSRDVGIQNLLRYYMGKNSPERQQFIIENLRVEQDLIEAAADVG